MDGIDNFKKFFIIITISSICTSFLENDSEILQKLKKTMNPIQPSQIIF